MEAPVDQQADQLPDDIYQRRWWTLGVLCLSLLIIVMDNTILNVALPTLVRDLGATTSQLQWIVDGYTLVFAGLLLTMGSLGDRFGRKGALMVGLLLFGVGSIASATATSADMLIATRAFMGIGGALIMPATLSLLTNVFRDPRERARAIAIWAGFSGVGVAIGPLTGGFLLEHFSWGSVFWVNIPIVVAGAHRRPLLRAHLEGPDGAEARPRRRGALHRRPRRPAVGDHRGPGQGLDLGSGRRCVHRRCGAAGRVRGVGAALRPPDARHALLQEPAVQRRQHRHHAHVLRHVRLDVPHHPVLQFVLGYTPLEAGVRMAPYALAMMIAAPLSARFVERFGSKVVVATGLLLVSAGMLSLSFITVSTGYPSLLARMFVMAVGMGLTMAPATESVMGSLPREKAGVGSAVNDTTRQVGGALGVAVIGSLVSSVYASQLTKGLSGFGLPAAAVDKAGEGLGTALAVGQQVGGSAGSQIAQVASTSFVDGLSAGLRVGAVVTLVAAAVVLAFLPARAGAYQGAADRELLDAVDGVPALDGLAGEQLELEPS